MYVEQASKVSLENVLVEVNDIKKGIELTKNEFENHQNPVLKEFLQKAGDKVQRITEDAEVALEAYRNVVQYFGETQKTMPPEQFFPIFQRFIKAYQDAEADLEKWRVQKTRRVDREKKAEEAKIERERMKKAYKESLSEEKNAVDQLRAIRRGARDRSVNNEIQDGAIDENLAYLKNQPYRRNDNKTRSFRRGQAASAQSRGMTSML